MHSLRCSVVVGVAVVAAFLFVAVDSKKAFSEPANGIRSREDLVTAVARDCITGEEALATCTRRKVYSYVNNLMGIQDRSDGRGLSDERLDEIIGARLSKYVTSHEFRFNLPEFLFNRAVVTYRPGRSLDDVDVEFPPETTAEEASSQARGLLKKKLLFPLLLLLKLKIKALTPLLLVLIGIKAVKAFVMSKISFLLVVGFMLLQLFKKGGMMMSMPMAMPAPTEPPPVYGPGPTPAAYGPPSPTPDTSYGPWEASNGNGNGNNGNGPYARWDSHDLAYSSYSPEVKTAQQLKQGV